MRGREEIITSFNDSGLPKTPETIIGTLTMEILLDIRDLLQGSPGDEQAEAKHDMVGAGLNKDYPLSKNECCGKLFDLTEDRRVRCGDILADESVAICFECSSSKETAPGGQK